MSKRYLKRLIYDVGVAYATVRDWVLTDAAFGNFELHFVRDKEKREVDFLICRDKKPWMLVECKSGSKSISENLIKFSQAIEATHNFQLCDDETDDRMSPASQNCRSHE